MRVFWIILTLVIAGSGAVVFMPESSASHPVQQTASQSEMASTPAAEFQIPAATPSLSEESPAAAKERAETNENISLVDDDMETAHAEIPSTTNDEAIPSEVAEESADLPANDDEITADSIIANLDSMMDAVNELDADDTTEAAEAESQSNDSSLNGWELLAEQANADDTDEVATNDAEAQTNTTEAETPAEAAPAAMTIARNEDGSINIGDTYTITGKGLKDNPYVVPWEYLVSLQQYYNPREGKKEIPSHIAMFDGAYVTIAGYLQFPLATPEPVECLVMLNQWDGCCIGVPPTPYDAIEVSLSEPASREQKFAVEGRIVGKLKIDPYLVGNWLIGLYLLTDASVDVSGTRTAEEVYGNTPSQLIPGAE